LHAEEDIIQSGETYILSDYFFRFLKFEVSLSHSLDYKVYITYFNNTSHTNLKEGLKILKYKKALFRWMLF